MTEMNDHKKTGRSYLLIAAVLSFVLFAVCGVGTVKAQTELTVKDVVVVNAKSVNVRSQPTTKSQAYGKVTEGTFLKRYEARLDGWSCIDYAGVPAYVKTEFLTPYTATDSTVVTAAPPDTRPTTSAEAIKGAALPAMAAAAAAPQASSGGNMVWIPKTGKKYHSRSGCSKMKNPSQVTEQQAISMGYTPCKVCH